LLILGRLAGISWLAGQTTRDGSRSALTFGDPNLAGNYFVACLFLVLASRHPRRPVPRTLAVLAIVLAIVFTGSNGAMVGMVVGVVAGLIVGRWRSRGPIAATGLACVLVVGAGLLVTSVNWTALQEQAAASGPVLHDSFGRSDSSSADRQVLLAEGVKLFWSGNLLGVGPGRTKNVLASIPAPYVKEAHNDYVATLVELGAIGGVGMVVLLTSIAARLQRVAGGTARGRLGVFAAGLPSPHFLVAIAASFLVSGAFYEVLHFRHLWAFLGLVAGLDLIRADTAQTAPREALGAASLAGPEPDAAPPTAGRR
jgi:O-antigen ligase